MRREDAEDLFDALIEGAIFGALKVTVFLFFVYGSVTVTTHYLVGRPEDPFLWAAVPAALIGLLGFYAGLKDAFYSHMVDPPEEP